MMVKGCFNIMFYKTTNYVYNRKAYNYLTIQATSERDEDQDPVIEEIGESTDEKSGSD